MRSKWPNLTLHLHFSRFHFLLDQVFSRLLFFTQHFISSNFLTISNCLEVSRGKPEGSMPKREKKITMPKVLANLGNGQRDYYSISLPKFPGLFIC